MSLSTHPHGRRRRRSHDGETRAQRKQRTREGLLEAALSMLEDRPFASLSLREVSRAAGISPAAFYRHFRDMDELGFALVDESFTRLRAMLRSARESDDYGGVIRNSVAILASHVQNNRQHFRFIARERGSGVPALRRAIRGEIRLVTSELATDLARFPALREWSSEDLGMIAALMVNTMVAIVEELLNVTPSDPLAERRVLDVAERQLRLIVLGVPQWRGPDRAGPKTAPGRSAGSRR